MNSLAKKVLVASLSVLLLLAACYGLITRELRSWDEVSAHAMRDYQRAVLDGEVHEALTRAMGETASYVQTGEPGYRNQAAEALARANTATTTLQRIAVEGTGKVGNAIHVGILARQQHVLRATEQDVAKAVAAVAAASRADVASALRLIYAHEAEADDLWQQTVVHHKADRLDNVASLEAHRRRTYWLIGASGIVFMLWIGLLIGYVRQRIVKPLKGLAELTSYVAAGDMSHSAPVTHRDEIGQLQRSYNQMVVELADQRQQLATLVDGLSRSRDAAEAANRAKSDFLANVSHELRTPMNGVVVTLDLMHETATDADQRKLSDMARKSARSLLGMLNDLLNFSRIEAGKLALETVAFDPRQLVNQTVSLHGRLAAAKGLAMRCQIADAVPAKLCGDPLRLGQILLNLLDNAIKFTEQGGIEVSVTLEPTPPGAARQREGATARPVWLRMVVTDTGIGIPAQAAHKIFQPFYQAEGSGVRKHGGVGLGLGIARELTRMMGGELAFKSEPGRGTSFWFTACLGADAPCGGEAARDAMPASRLPAGCPVLLVEDHHDNREVMMRILQRRGLRMTGAEDGRQALALAAAEKFDLILMDCQMPVMDGFDATRAIRALDGERARVPIVALTAYGLTGDKQRYFDAGFDDLVVKPYSLDEIEAVLYRWLVQERRDSAPGDAAGPAPERSAERWTLPLASRPAQA